MRLVLDDKNDEPSDHRVDPALVKVMLRGRRWFEALATGRVQSLIEIAEAEGVSDRYVSSLIPLAFLAPDIVSQILAGSQPIDLTAEALTKGAALPLSWLQQRQHLGFDR